MKLDELRNRPATHIFTGRINCKYLATLILFWRDRREPVSSTSELIRLSLETFADFLVLNNKAKMVESIEDSLKIIDECGFAVKTNTKYLMQELSREDVSFDFLKSTDPGHTLRTKQHSSNKVSSGDLQTAQALLQEKELEELQERITSSKSNTQEILQHLDISKNEDDGELE